MKAIVLDMYGVIVKQTGDDFVPYVQQTFPNLSAEDCIYVDDRSGNLNAAKKVGMKPILLNTRNESYEGVSVNSFNELEKEINSTNLSIIFDLDGTLWESI